MQLIVNADDFGLSYNNSRAIVNAFRNGIVSSTTVLANVSQAKYSWKILEQAAIDGLGVGVHLNLTFGKPLTPSLTEKLRDGQFDKSSNIFKQIDDPDLVYQELLAQVLKVQSQLPVEISHLDSHHHIHQEPSIFEILTKLAKQWKVGVRCYDEVQREQIKKWQLPCTDALCVKFFDTPNISINSLIRILEQLLAQGYQSVELMCHPGMCDPELQMLSTYNVQRDKEYDTLTSPEVLSFIQQNKIVVISYNELA